MTAATATDRAPRLGPAWIAVYLGLLLAIALLAAWVFFIRQPPVEYRDVPGEMSADERVQLEQGLAALEDRQQQIDALKATLGEDICPPGKVRAESPAAGQGGDAMRQRGNSATAPAPVPTPDARAENVAPSTPETASGASGASAPAPLSTAALRDRLRQATAFVITPISDDKVGSGTGFFVAPEMLMTNRHVVEGAEGGEVFVTSKSLGQLRKGRIVTMSKGSQFGAPDFALVNVPGAGQSVTLPLTFSFDALQPVVAAGYPSAITDSDISKRKLFNGDMSAAPSLVMNQGSIQTLQPVGDDVVIVHSTDISQGNSGGPLVDRCGRVVGINTFIVVDSENAGRVSYALSARGVAGFLQGARVAPRVEQGDCPD
jgi:S1-C subfamily serine protease